MRTWTRVNVLRKLKATPGFDSFISLDGRGYLPIQIGKTHVFIFREDVGVSYYFKYPIVSVDDAAYVGDFMIHAINYLNQEIERNRRDRLLYKPQPPSKQ